MRRSAWLFFLGVTCAVPSMSEAAVGTTGIETWYVRPATECPNNGDGLASSCAASAGGSGAFNSFANIIWTATVGVDDGDTLCVSGTHRESLTPGGSGVSGLPILIKGDCSGVATGTITGADVESSWTGPDGNGNYVSGNTYTTPYSVLIDGVSAKHGSALDGLQSGEWYFSGSAIHYHGIPDGRVIEVGVRGANIDGSTSASSYLTIENIRFEATRYQAARSAVVFKDCVDIIVRGNTFYSHRGGVDFRGTCTNVLASGNTLTLVSDGLDANQDVGKPTGVRFINNVLTGSWSVPATTYTSSNWLSGIEATHAAIDQECIAVTGSDSGVVVQGNTCAGFFNGVFLLPTDSRSNFVVTGNTVSVIDRNGVQVSCLGGCTLTDVRITGNVVSYGGWGNGASSFCLSMLGATLSTGSTVTITNNLCYRYSNGLYLNGSAALYMVGTIANNIIYEICETANCTEGGYSSYYVNATNWQNQSASLINNNWYYQGAGQVAGWRNGPGGSYNTSFANWLSVVTPQETNSANGVDPQFIAAPSDFRPVISSPLVRAGARVDHCYDVRGRICNSPPDIGAYQATSGDPAAARAVRQ